MFQGQEKVNITLKQDDYQFIGTVQYVTDRHIVVTCTPADAVHCHEGMPIVIAKGTDGLYYQLETQILRSQKNSIIAPLLAPQVLQRRRSERAPCSMTTTYIHLRPRNTGSKPIEETPQPIFIQDISIGGAKACTAEVLLANTPVNLTLDMGEEGTLNVEAVALRCIKREGNDALHTPELPYQTFFRFKAIPRLDSMVLIRYVQQRINCMGPVVMPRLHESSAA